MTHQPRRLHFYTIVWGEAFAGLFMQFVLPSLLAKGNLPDMPGLITSGSRFHLYTTSEDAKRICCAPLYSYFNELIPVDVHILLDTVNSKDVTERMAACYRHLVESFIQDEDGVILIPPDVVWSAGSFASLSKIVSEGKRLIAPPYFRVAQETFLPLLRDGFFEKNGFLCLPSRLLVKLSLQHFHPIAKGLFWDADGFTSWPSMIFWKSGEGEIVARYFHAFPLFISLERKEDLLRLSSSETLDGGPFLSQVVRDFQDVYMVKDSDEMFCCEVVKSSYQVHPVTNSRPKLLDIALWAYSYSYPLHRHFFNHRVRIHTGEDLAISKQVEEASEKVADAIHSCLEFFGKVPPALRELDALIGPVAPQLVEKDYKGYDFFHYQGRFYGIAQGFSCLDLPKEPAADPKSAGKFFSGTSIEEVKSQIDGSGYVGVMVPVGEGYRGYNLIQYLSGFYGLAACLGEVDLAQMDKGSLERLQEEEKIFFGLTLAEVKSRIALSGCVGNWALLEKNYLGYDIFQHLSVFYGLDKSVPGTVAGYLSSETLERLQAEGWVFTGKTRQEVREMIRHRAISPQGGLGERPTAPEKSSSLPAPRPSSGKEERTPLLRFMDCIHESLAQGDMEAAQEISKRAVDQFGDHPLAWVLRAKVMQKTDQLVEALSAIQQSLKMGETPEALMELKQIALKFGNQEIIREIQTQLSRRYPDWDSSGQQRIPS